MSIARALIIGPICASGSVAGATFSARHASGEHVAELLVHARLHVHAIRAYASLPAVAKLRGEQARDSGVEIGVVEDDEGRVAAEFQRQLLECLRRFAREILADRRRAGERDLAHAAVMQPVGDGRNRVLARRRDQVEHARRHAGFMREQHERERGERRVLGRLADDRAARRQRGRDLARDHREREIPRRDRRDDADRLLHRRHPLAALLLRNDVAVDARRFVGEPLHVGRAVQHLAASFRERLALFERDEPAERVGVLHHQIVPAMQHRRALFGQRVAPGGERARGGVGGGAGVGCTAVGDVGDHFAGRRVRHAEALAARGGDPLAVDEIVAGGSGP